MLHEPGHIQYIKYVKSLYNRSDTGEPMGLSEAKIIADYARNNQDQHYIKFVKAVERENLEKDKVMALADDLFKSTKSLKWGQCCYIGRMLYDMGWRQTKEKEPEKAKEANGE